MIDGPSPENAEWKSEGWDEAYRRKLTLGLYASPAARLAWLEQAIVLAWASGALPRPRAPLEASAPAAETAAK